MQIRAIVATKTAEVFKFEPKLISYITSRYKIKSDMMYDKTLRAEIIEPMLPRFKEAGDVCQMVSQV